MGQSEKSALYQELKQANVEFEKTYQEYTEAELQAAVTRLRIERLSASDVDEITGPDDGPHYEPDERDVEDVELPSAPGVPAPPVESRAPEVSPPSPPVPAAPVARRDPLEVAGQRQNTNPEMEPIRVDPDTGFIWYQEEVRKPAAAKPRGRRVLTYMDSGVQTKQFSGQDENGTPFTETFEVAGNGAGVQQQAKITLPSYQVGIYKDPRFPFKIHVYNERRGFDYFDVANYYGGIELVPTDVKRTYVSNNLCFDMRTVIRNIQTAFRQLQLAGVISTEGPQA